MNNPLLENILDAVSAEFGVPRAQLLAPSRSSQDIAWARQVAMYLDHRLNRSGCWAETGRHFNRDRTTVRHAFLKVEANRDREDFDSVMERLENVCATAAV